MVTSFPQQDQSLFHNLTSTLVSRVADPLLSILHWAGQSTDTYGLVCAIKYTDRLLKRNTWITALIYVSNKKAEQYF